MPVYIIPAEVKIMAETPDDAMLIAQFLPATVCDNDDGTMHGLIIDLDATPVEDE